MPPKQSEHFLSLVVPVYKQEKTIVRNLEAIKTALDNIRYDHEIIAVIDGEVDGSFRELKKAHIPKVRILAYPENQGKSYAIRLGMHEAKGDYVMFMDAGNEIDTSGISMLLEHMEWYNADIIVGSKRHPASQVSYSLMRKILSFGYYYLVKILFGISVRDTQAGIKIFRKTVLEKVLPRLIEKKFAGDLEILVVAKECGFDRIFEAPIKMDYRLGSITSAATLTSIKGIFQDTLAIYYRKNILRYYRTPHQKLTYPTDLKTVTP